MLRLVSISQFKRKIWSNQELHFIDHNLLLKKDIEINWGEQIEYNFFNKKHYPLLATNGYFLIRYFFVIFLNEIERENWIRKTYKKQKLIINTKEKEFSKNKYTFY